MMNRRRAIMAASGASADPYLYKDGVISPTLGGFNTTGYKYNPTAFAQSLGEEYISIRATNKYSSASARGGLTYTSDNPLPATLTGKTLHVKGYVGNSAEFAGGKSYVWVFVSESVVDDSAHEKPQNSTAFVNSISQSWYTDSLEAGATKNFEMTLSLTQVGYLSLVLSKEHQGLNYVRFTEVWTE